MAISYSIPPRKKRDFKRWNARMYSAYFFDLAIKTHCESFVEAFSKIKIDSRVDMVDHKWVVHGRATARFSFITPPLAQGTGERPLPGNCLLRKEAQQSSLGKKISFILNSRKQKYV